MKFLNIKTVTVIAIALFLLASLAAAQLAGESNALERLNGIYLKAACKDSKAFRNTLEAEDLTDLKVTDEQRLKWVDFQLSKCAQ